MALHLGEKSQQRNSVSPAVFIAAVVVLVLFIGGMAYYFLAPHTERVHPRPLTAAESWLQQKAKESGGDFTKLSPADQKQLFSTAGPSAPVTLRMAYEAQKSK
jgi:hypothetical protein